MEKIEESGFGISLPNPLINKVKEKSLKSPEDVFVQSAEKEKIILNSRITGVYISGSYGYYNVDIVLRQ